MTDQSSISMTHDTSASRQDTLGTMLESAVSCWSASASLKSSAGEGGLTDVQVTAVRNWKAQLLSASMHYLIKAAGLSADSNHVNVSYSFPPTAERPSFSLELIRRLQRPAAEFDHESVPAAGALSLLAPDEPGAGLAAVEAEYLAATAGDAAFDPVRPAVAPAAAGTLASDAAAVDTIAADGWRLLQTLLARLARAGEDADGTADLAWTVRRLFDSVLRPLGETLTRLPAAPDRPAGNGSAADGTPVDEEIWRLAREATGLRPSPGEPAEMLEAVAALQDLACRLAPADGPGNRLERIAELRRLQSAAPPGIEPAPDGPYLVTNVDDIHDWLGVTISMPPQVALCRCGASQTKPYCDGAHARTGFTGAKSPKRIPDQRDTYRGLQATIFDNRGTCAHSGFCTDRLSSVFRLREEPFVLPSGGRFDEITQAVRACPSGALSMAIGDNEIRDVVDPDRPPAIEISKDGPYRVTGGIALTGRQGEDHPRNAGASHEHYSLCRCGQSQNKPFCSGMHWYVDFHDPVHPEDYEPTIFEWAGGLPAFRRMTNLFYSKYAPQDPELSRLFADMNPGHPEHVAAWLSEVFGGPPNYSERHGGYSHMISEHVGKRLTEKQRSRWAALMSQAADEAGLPIDPEFRAAFIAYIEWGTRIAVENSQQDARPPAGMTVPRWWWVCDATPAARISALAPAVVEEEVELPGDDVELSFEQHIKKLFRAQDRNSMKFVFDLWAVEDVQQHADAILHRLQNGSMPCDGAWAPEKVAVFSRWVDAGKPA
ncbi:CDGSH iron-sulfur domain-containing protein [Actinoplanes sp. NEAU-A12]|uniref:CDGSH iron-sulfur domain-containing protein n=1 Tax=Actinoplanes sandaracinus TaxID=3045177 RepID=A0ABT6WL35_9ACTN|nr:CDGSH iron-sulfur domain-containing protein [Actinoplanes sandaracinus]MDI6100447.1 CDGSH iron-sulfur domain-containing protein [Actinoplanes sandaracinus]